MKSTIEELDQLRQLVRETVAAYTERLESEIGLVRSAVAELRKQKEPTTERLHDLRDMLTLLRHFSVKADKGRRKDLKKIDSLVGDLRMMIENW
ncbi:MAG TPA: hypothetical protein VIS74_04870 [Chthoniobacterales bacterium]